MSGIVYIVSAPSGSGKSTLTAELLKSVPNLEFSISYTTRGPRGSEQNGREYFFVTPEEFQRMLAEDEFLEHACVFGDYYGTARRFLRDAKARGNDLLLDIDVQGAGQVKRKLPDAVSIFILPPSRDELEKRLRCRSEGEKEVEDPGRRRTEADREATIQRRLRAAAKEIENYPNYDYILVNDQLEQSIDLLKGIVLAERLRRSGRALSAEDAKLVSAAELCRLPRCGQRVQQILSTFMQPAAPGSRAK
ncbi:MAG: guanylate kinase [Terriglobales bacterium]